MHTPCKWHVHYVVKGLAWVAKGATFYCSTVRAGGRVGGRRNALSELLVTRVGARLPAV